MCLEYRLQIGGSLVQASSEVVTTWFGNDSRYSWNETMDALIAVRDKRYVYQI